MDPFSIISAGTTVASMALQIFGGHEASQAAQQQYEVQKQEIQSEQQIESQKQQAMELDAQRKSMEVLRNAQRARAVATYNATTQGAQFGSGLQGGYGKISGEANVNLLGISQSRQIGENVFSLNQQISQDKIQMSDLQSKVDSGKALAGLGQMIGQNSQAISRLTQFGIGQAQNAFSGFGGGGDVPPGAMAFG